MKMCNMINIMIVFVTVSNCYVFSQIFLQVHNFHIYLPCILSTICTQKQNMATQDYDRHDIQAWLLALFDWRLLESVS